MATTGVARRSSRGVALVVTALASVVLATGCSGRAEREDDARAAATHFSAVLAADDTDAACPLLAESTMEELERSEGMPCPDALAKQDLPELGVVRSVDVYGRQARVVADGDTVFLTEDHGWKVRAAGCVEREEHPYDCTLTGG